MATGNVPALSTRLQAAIRGRAGFHWALCARARARGALSLEAPGIVIFFGEDLGQEVGGEEALAGQRLGGRRHGVDVEAVKLLCGRRGGCGQIRGRFGTTKSVGV